MTDSVVIGDLTFRIRRSARRQTVGITIERDGKLVISAPADCPRDLLERLADEKRFWVYTKLAEKDLLQQPNGKKEFVNGEGFNYLGRSYRLLLVDRPAPGGKTPALRLQQGRFMLSRDQLPRAQEHFERWYVRHGRSRVLRTVNLLADRLGVQPQKVEVRNLGFRWGSCSRAGTVNVHWRCALLPPRIIEYVVAHELVHLLEPLHSPGFWKRLERAMPDYELRKRWLAENGGRY